MRRSTLVALALLVICGAQLASAQSPTQPAGAANAAQAAVVNAEIRGRIVDGKSEAAIPRASVSVRIKGATTVLTGAIADANGTFRIQGLRPGVYSLRITYIGFAPNVQDVTLTPRRADGEPRQREAHRRSRSKLSGRRGQRRARGDDGRARSQRVSREGRRTRGRRTRAKCSTTFRPCRSTATER